MAKSLPEGIHGEVKTGADRRRAAPPLVGEHFLAARLLQRVALQSEGLVDCRDLSE
jgi:hypothetical protein